MTITLTNREVGIVIRILHNKEVYLRDRATGPDAFEEPAWAKRDLLRAAEIRKIRLAIKEQRRKTRKRKDQQPKSDWPDLVLEQLGPCQHKWLNKDGICVRCGGMS